MTFPDLIPDGWLKDYVSTMLAAQNEMPAAFHFMAGATIIGQMIGLRAWATLAKGVRVYPHINALLLSPAGQCRRGEGTKITVDIARRAGMNILSGKTTPEGLIDELQEQPSTLLYVEELSMLLTKQDFQRPIIPTLTKLLLHGDGPVDTRTRGLGKVTLPTVNLSALFTSAPEWFMTTIPSEAFGGGMMSRFLVCCLDDREIHHIDIRADDEDGREDSIRLADSLRFVPNVLKGHIRGTLQAQRWIEQWYLANETAEVENDKMLPHRNRKPANLLRLAMIFAASAGESEITEDILKQTLTLLDWLEPTLLKLYGMTNSTVDTMDKGEKRILNKLTHNGGEMLHSTLARSCASYFRGGVKEMKICLNGLEEKSLVDAMYRRNRDGMWPPEAWKVHDSLKQQVG